MLDIAMGGRNISGLRFNQDQGLILLLFFSFGKVA
jgi:hypothetical protein